MKKSIIFFLTIILFLIGLIAFLVLPVSEHKRVYQDFERMPLDEPPQIEITTITVFPVSHSSGCSCGHEHK